MSSEILPPPSTLPIQNVLTEADLAQLVENTSQYRNLPSVQIGSFSFDRDALLVFGISMVVFAVIYYFFGVGRIVKYAPVFFAFYLLLSLYNLKNSSSDVSDVDTEKVQQSSQQAFFQGGVAIFILVFVFINNLSIRNKHDFKQILLILIITMILSTFSLISIEFKNNSEQVRFVRLINQSLYNMALVMFAMTLFMIWSFKSTGSVD